MQTFTEHLLQTRGLDAGMEKAQPRVGAPDGHGQLHGQLAGCTLLGSMRGERAGISCDRPLPDTSALPAGGIPTNVWFQKGKDKGPRQMADSQSCYTWARIMTSSERIRSSKTLFFGFFPGYAKTTTHFQKRNLTQLLVKWRSLCPGSLTEGGSWACLHDTWVQPSLSLKVFPSLSTSRFTL